MEPNKRSRPNEGALRAVCHLDVNCFYASVEMARLYPSLEGLPVAVSQRNLLVTTNYRCRDQGVPKMCSIIEAKEICPEIVIIESEMSRYREAHRRLFELLRTRFHLAPERASIDEAYLDITGLVEMEEAANPLLTDETVVYGADEDGNDGFSFEDECNLFMARAGKCANDIRQAIREEMRLETSCGVSLNKSFAKFASNLNKPSRTTIIPRSAHEALLRQLKPREIHGIGPVLLDKINELCGQRMDSFIPESLLDLQRLHPQELEALGTQGGWIYQMCRGIDNREVKDKGPPGSFGFQAAHRTRLGNMQELYAVILDKSSKMAARLEEDEFLYNRICRTLGVSFLFNGKTVTRSLGMPARGENRALEICSVVMDVLARHQKKDPLVLQSQRFGLTASGFSGENSGIAESSISRFLTSTAKPDFGKSEEREHLKPAIATGIQRFLSTERVVFEYENEHQVSAASSAPQGGIQSFFSRGEKPRTHEPLAPPRSNVTAFFGMPKPRIETTCPVCGHQVEGNLTAHVNGHFEEELEPEKDAKTPPLPEKKKPRIEGPLHKMLRK